MRLHNLRLRGITEAFPNEVCVDFDALGQGLIAIVGESGVGKSTLIGSVFAALFRQLPGQKRSLYDFATHPQPETDLTFSVNGARYRSLLKIDPSPARWRATSSTGMGSRLPTARRSPLKSLSANAPVRRTSSSAASSRARSAQVTFSRWIGANGKSCSSGNCSGWTG